jgi:hypothetical protein
MVSKIYMMKSYVEPVNKSSENRLIDFKGEFSGSCIILGSFSSDESACKDAEQKAKSHSWDSYCVYEIQKNEAPTLIERYGVAK